MNMYKKVALLSLLTAFSFNALAVETTKAIETTKNTNKSGLFRTWVGPICQRAILYGAIFAYFKHFNPNEKGTEYTEQAVRKIIDYVIAGVILYDPVKEDYKTLKTIVAPLWEAGFEKLDELFETNAPVAPAA